MNKARDFDLILWGATGFTGRRVFEYLAQHAPKDFKWAIAGRNKAQLEALRTRISEHVSSSAENIDILIADSGDKKSIDELVQKTRVVLSTVGPFMKYGTPVVDACVRFGTHYLDSTGETPWVSQLINKYHETAKNEGTLIVPMCGFDSIPADLGVFYVRKECGGSSVKNVSAFVEYGHASPSGGTIASIMNLMEDKKAAAVLQNPLALVPQEQLKGKKSKQPGSRKFISYEPLFKAWAVPFIMEAANVQVVQRSNFLLDYGKENFTYREAFLVKSFFGAVLTYLGLIVVLIMLGIPFVRNNVLKRLVPQSGQGPSEQEMKKAFFRYNYVIDTGKKQIVARMKGGEPGYLETSKLLAESALCLATQRDQLPCGKEGGVLTPAVAMGELLIERLQKIGLAPQKVDK